MKKEKHFILILFSLLIIGIFINNRKQNSQTIAINVLNSDGHFEEIEEISSLEFFASISIGEFKDKEKLQELLIDKFDIEEDEIETVMEEIKSIVWVYDEGELVIYPTNGSNIEIYKDAYEAEFNLLTIAGTRDNDNEEIDENSNKRAVINPQYFYFLKGSIIKFFLDENANKDECNNINRYCVSCTIRSDEPYEELIKSQSNVFISKDIIGSNCNYNNGVVLIGTKEGNYDGPSRREEFKEKCIPILVVSASPN